MINNLDLGKKIIKDKISLIPKNPGVYKMLNEKKRNFVYWQSKKYTK